jgi:hypothetical protein
MAIHRQIAGALRERESGQAAVGGFVELRRDRSYGPALWKAQTTSRDSKQRPISPRTR